MAYATPAQMLQRFDYRMIGDLVADDGTQVSSANLLTDANLQAALDDASGAIDGALRASDRYTETELSSLSQTDKHLVRITCDITVLYLVDRRPHAIRMTEILERILARAAQHIEDLRSGKNILDINAHDNAGSPTVDAPTSVEIQLLNLTRYQTQHVYPVTIRPNGV